MDDGRGSQANNGSRLRKKEKFWKKFLPCLPKTNLTAQSLKSPIMNGKVAPQQDVSIKQSQVAQMNYCSMGPSMNDITPKFQLFDHPPSPCHPMSPLTIYPHEVMHNL